MKPSLILKLDQLTLRLAELDATLQSEDATRDLDRYRAMTMERAEIEPVVARFAEYRNAEADLQAAAELAREPDMRDFADEERTSAQKRMADIAEDL